MPDFTPVRPGGYVRASPKQPAGRPPCTFCDGPGRPAGAVIPLTGSDLVLIVCRPCMEDPAIAEAVKRRLAADPGAVELPRPDMKPEPPTEAELAIKHGMKSDDPRIRPLWDSYLAGKTAGARPNEW